MTWLIFAILTFLAGFANPYVGLFSVFSVVDILFSFAMDVNISRRVKMDAFFRDEQPAFSEKCHRSAKHLTIVWKIAEVILTIIWTIVSLSVFVLASGCLTGNRTVMTPWTPVSTENMPFCTILLFCSIAAGIVQCVLIFLRCTYLLKLKVDPLHVPEGDLDLSFPTVVYVFPAVSFALSVLSRSIGMAASASVIAFYLEIGIVLLLVRTYNRRRSGNRYSFLSDYFIAQMQRGGDYNKIFSALTIFCALIVLTAFYIGWKISGILILPRAVLAVISAFFVIAEMMFLIRSILNVRMKRSEI